MDGFKLQNHVGNMAKFLVGTGHFFIFFILIKMELFLIVNFNHIK